MRVQGLRVSKLIINTDGASDNKNRIVFAFLMFIVHLGWYDCVEYYFLIPGHSHWIVDRDCFSHIGRARFFAACFCVLHFWNVFLPRAFSKTAIFPQRIDLPEIFNFRMYFEPHLRELKGH